MDLPNYPYHRPVERVGWVFASGPTLGAWMFYGAYFFLWAWRVGLRAYFLDPISCPPSPCVRTAWTIKGCNYSCDDCCFHVSVQINPDRRHKWSVNDDPLGFAPVFHSLLFSLVSRRPLQLQVPLVSYLSIYLVFSYSFFS